MNAVPTMIWLPDGKGAVDIRVWRCMIAAREYDSRLQIGLNNQTGDWCVFIALERGTLPEQNDMYPIYGLGRDPSEFPHPDDLQKKLFQMDLVRQGDEALDKLNRHNEQLKKDMARAADDATGEAAEAFAWGTNRLSNDIGKRIPRVYIGESVKHRQAPR